MKLVINGQEMEFAEGASALDVLDKLPKDVKKNALVARHNGKLISLMEPLPGDGEVEFVTFDDPDGRWTLRAVTPHAAVLAADGRELRLELPAPDQRPHADAPPRPGVGAPAIPAVGVSGLRPVPTQ